jgi:type I restriction enzyme M protein
MNDQFKNDTKKLIDDLKGICSSYGLGGDGNEFKIITQVFLYKFLNDKFGYEIKRLDKKLAGSSSWEKDIAKYSENDFNLLLARMPAGSIHLRPEHFISYLFNNSNKDDFASMFDDTLRDIAIANTDIFSVHTITGEQILLFDNNLSNYIVEKTERDNFCRAIINQLTEFSFEHVFDEGFDFFSTIFEYMIKDYNKDGGGKYAEYFTPHAVSKVMARILVDEGVSNVTCYDPAAGSGTLLMNLAHAIGPDKCSIFSQDISQKSSGLLRLNLILNNLTHSIHNIVKGDTLLRPKHIDKKFDYIVSNPPFKLDFSDIHADLKSDSNTERFFAGVPNILKKDKTKMEIYLLFIQHILYSLAKDGKAAVVVPTGFITAKSGIAKKILKKLVDEKMLRGVVSMPANIFANTPTSVSILFIDKANKKGDVVLMNASKLGKQVKEGKNKKTLLSLEEEDKIISTFKKHEATEDFSVVVSYDDIKGKNYSLSAGQYFEIKIEYTEISKQEFDGMMKSYAENLNTMFKQSAELEDEVQKELNKIRHEDK